MRNRKAWQMYPVPLFFVAVIMIMGRAPESRLVAQTAPRLNRMIEALEAGRPALAGETWTWVEQEHQPYVIEKLKKALDTLMAKRNARGQVMLAPYVRIPTEGDQPKRWIVKQVLEAGAMGIIVPYVETAQQARDLVQAMRFAQPNGSKFPEPRGRRGCCTVPRNWMLESRGDYWEGGLGDVWPLNPSGELFALPMIESSEGVNNISEILGVPGIPGVVIGPGDLNASLGEGWVVRGPKTEAAIQKVLSTCASAGKYCGMVTTDEAATKKYLDMGAHFMYTTYKENASTSPASF